MTENKEQSKMVPKRRFKAFENEDGWVKRELGEILDFSITTNSLSRNMLNYYGGELRSIHYGDILINYGSILDVKTDVIPFVTGGKVKDFSSQLLKNGDIVFADAAEDETVGKAVEINGLRNADLVAGLHTIVGRPLSKFAERYLGYYINSNSYHRQLIPLMQGTKVSSISKNTLQKTKIIYPNSINEQQDIGDFFTNLDQTITLQQQKMEKLKAMKSAYLSEMFPAEGERKPKRRFPGFTDDWEQRELGEIGNTFTGLSGKTKEDFGHGDGKFITYMNVFSNPVADLGGLESVEIDNKQFQVKLGDVLFTTSSETPEEVGMSSVWLGNAENIYLNSFCFGYRPTIEFDKHYLAFMLRSAPIRKKFQLLAQGISRYNISKNKVMKMPIPVPNIVEQKVLGAFFKNLDQTIAFQQQKLEKLQNIKKAYLNEMFI
ncbi:restriction endonuclease subunit S [Lactococcus formosensis]|uniref:restriction endonuclease subunit S n=1 Tax=Lactococcus formosensis TaxID=1281486 RepID=UPI002434A117|nr:restriction endonuclease subunit S [Lactococcus formosensis]MDG6119780.1 restriction endonuclease subunit S [Lactococcus formosensis]